jgi:hypothetical protein
MSLRGRVMRILWALAHRAYNYLEDRRPAGGWR